MQHKSFILIDEQTFK